MAEPLQLALQVLSENRPAVATGIVRLVRQVEPRWANIDELVSINTHVSLLREAGSYLRGGPEDPFLAVVRDLLRMRRLAGFELSDFISVFFCYLPVMRKVLVAKAPTPLEGLRAYDAIESVVLPLMNRLAAAAVTTVQDTTKPEGSTLVGMRERFTMIDVENALGDIPEFLVEQTKD